MNAIEAMTEALDNTPTAADMAAARAAANVAISDAKEAASEDMTSEAYAIAAVAAFSAARAAGKHGLSVKRVILRRAARSLLLLAAEVA